MASNRPSRGQNVSGQHSFASLPSTNIPRSAFNRSFGVKTTFNSGELIPVFVDESLPGDTFSANFACLARLLSPTDVPVMENIYIDFQFWSVPVRLVWDNWQRFMGERLDPDDTTTFEVPYMTAPAGGYAAESLSDYLGLPIGKEFGDHSSLFHRAYALIWNEWYRSQDLQDRTHLDTDDGPDDPDDYPVLKRGKRHDYFTSALPAAQKGDPVTLPIGSTAPLIGNPQISTNAAFTVSDGTNVRNVQGGSGSPYFLNAAGAMDGTSSLSFGTSGLNINLAAPSVPGTTPYADLSSATASTINEIRTAFQIQKMLERDQRSGSRYVELLRAHFGVISPDARLQRPEFLGGSTQVISINPVSQTATFTPTSPVGLQSAYGISQGVHRGFMRSFTEHCIIIGLASVRADLNYQQGIPRHFLRQTRYDFYWPSLSHLGEQVIFNKEIFQSEDSEIDDAAFGFQERHAEYRYKPSLITGKMRSDYAQSLDYWHLAQDFDSLPVLNASFIEEDPPMDRILAVTDESQMVADLFFNLKCVRPMPTYAVPGLVDHF